MADNDSIYRERFYLTLEHKPVDRCPIDLAGTPFTSLSSPEAGKRLAEKLEISGETPEDYDKFDQRILEHWDIDFRSVGVMVPYENERNRRISNTEHVDAYGIGYRFSGLYWEIVDYPLRGATIDDVAAYEFPSLENIPDGLLDNCEAKAKRLHDETPYVIVGEHPVFGVLELACWLCGYDHIMMMLGLNPNFIHLLFSKILTFQKPIIRAYYERIGRYIHLTTSGDDFGTQTGPFMSPQMWREYVKPYMKDRIEYTARFTDAVYMHHSCGAVFDIIPDLIDINVKVLNPIQPAAAGMSPDRLKSSYGKDMVFFGGLDTQEVLPSDDSEEIRQAVLDLIATMHPLADGGYVFAPAHNIQADVSSEAIIAMYDAAVEASGRIGKAG